jgi:glycosyltransferase involved in cell wall biosynthesis
MRVAHLTSVHPHHDVRIYVKECRSLRAAGHDVILIAPGERAPVDEAGICHVVVEQRTGRMRRMLGTTWAVLRAALASRAEVTHLHDPELIPVGVALKLCGRRVIYDAHENTPHQVLNKKWLPRSLRRTMSRLVDLGEKIAAHLFDGVVAATPAIAARYPRAKRVIVQNFPIQSEFGGHLPQRAHGGATPIVYIGRIAEIRGAVEMVQAIEIARRQQPALRLVVAGEIASEALCRHLTGLPGWGGVDFLGWQSRAQIASLLGGARAGLVALHPTASYVDSYPVKMFEYMAAGLPVIASDFPLWRDIVEGAGCGVLVNPLDPEAIAAAMLKLHFRPEESRAMGDRGSRAVASRFNWECEAVKLVDFYAGLRAG